MGTQANIFIIIIMTNTDLAIFQLITAIAKSKACILFHYKHVKIMWSEAHMNIRYEVIAQINFQ